MHRVCWWRMKNGREALQMFSSAPDMDGYEAVRRICALGTARQIPMVAMTAPIVREDIEKCLDAGMNDHLGKPLDREEALVKLHRYVRLQRADIPGLD
ncbi:putative Sensor histidine kinase RcsC [Hollandina sp. SP2]